MLNKLPGVSIDLTTELRWFFDGPLPSDVRSWFTRDGVGLVERRCDTYQLDGRVDIGVKQRSRQTLELKRRTRPPEPVSIADDACGHMETWRRWSPADGLLALEDDTIWVGIDKTIIKRRFGIGGQELPLSEQSRAMTGEGCDAEIVALSANGREAWTFAFAAFGQLDTQRDLLSTTWGSLTERQACPEQLQLDTDRSYGYPEWLKEISEVQSPSPVSALGHHPESRSSDRFTSAQSRNRAARI